MVILIQGAMDVEIDKLIEYYKPREFTTVTEFDFHIAEYRGHKIVISKTKVGLINASVATTIAIESFKPDLVINQGCAGAHVPDIRIGDIVVGDRCVYINNFYTNPKAKGEGSNSLDWYPCKRSYEIFSTPEYVKLADEMEWDGKKRVGILGSGDIFSKEHDRIEYIHSLFGELCEDMESIAAFKVCELFGIDRLAVRIISNNELIDGSFEYGVCGEMQRFVIDFVERMIEERNG